MTEEKRPETPPLTDDKAAKARARFAAATDRLVSSGGGLEALGKMPELEMLEEATRLTEGRGSDAGSQQDDPMAMMRERAARGYPEAALAILERIPDIPPEPGDEMPDEIGPGEPFSPSR